MKQSSLLPSLEVNMNVNDPGEIPLNLPKKPIHGRGKELRNFKEKGTMPSSSNIAPQMSSFGKRNHSLDTDGVDDIDDRNFKHIRTKEHVVADDTPFHDLGHQRSCYGDSGDVVDQKSDSNSFALKLVEASAKPSRPPTSFPPMAPEPSMFEGVSFVENMAQSFENVTWGKLCENFLSKSLDDVLTMDDEVEHALQSCTEILSLKSARHTGLKNLIEEKLKQIEAANEDLYQVEIKMVDLKKEMKMDLESKKQELGIFKIIS
ncbi:hypothetical protein LIER_17505 [Lithospermum erythrorhizon]|uniref:Uncharacterized protein n=1 Tax=Lithospermum erythrorhizon TaxID=34254 RepID=A0AAV3QAT6_LITER